MEGEKGKANALHNAGWGSKYSAFQNRVQLSQVLTQIVCSIKWLGGVLSRTRPLQSIVDRLHSYKVWKTLSRCSDSWRTTVCCHSKCNDEGGGGREEGKGGQRASWCLLISHLHCSWNCKTWWMGALPVSLNC